MARSIALFAAVVTLVAGGLLPAICDAEDGFGIYRVTASVVNVREGPNRDRYSAIGRLRAGDRVNVKKIDRDTYSGSQWAQVDSDFDGWSDGWVRFDLLAEMPNESILEYESSDDYAAPEYWTKATIGLAILFLLVLFLLPGLVASKRRHHNSKAIWGLLLLFGWTGLGWSIAMIWSLTAVKRSGN